MNTPVNFEIVDLLMDKGFENNLIHDGMGSYHHNVSIAEVVMWLYENHSIWISVDIEEDDSFYYSINDVIKKSSKHSLVIKEGFHFKIPTEAYLAAIDYTLKNLI